MKKIILTFLLFCAPLFAQTSLGPKIPAFVGGAQGATYWTQGNQMLRMLQALVQPNVINLTTSTPPISPSNGDTYVVASGGTGLWSGHDTQIAYWTTDDPQVPAGKWEFWPPLNGWLASNQADGNVYKFNGSTWVLLSTAPTTGPRPTIADWHGWSWTGGVSTSSFAGNFAGYGDSPTIAGNGYTPSSIAPTATDAGYFRFNVNTGTSFFGGLTSGNGANLQGIFTLGIMQYFAQRVRITTGGSERVWIGMIDGTDPTPIGSQNLNTNTPAENFVGFRYSTSASDTHWMAITNNAGSQTATDTGITPDTNPHVFAVTQSASGATINFLIDGTQVATSSTNVPSNSAPLRAINQIQALGNVSNNMDTTWVYWETNP